MNKKLLIGITLLGFALILVGLIISITFFKDDNGKKDNNSEDSVNNNNDNKEVNIYYYMCTKPDLINDKYTISYIYEFCFEDDSLNYGNTKYVYSFKNIDDYNAFEIKNNKNFNPIGTENNKEKLTKTYIFDGGYSAKDINTIDDYIKYLKKLNYTCKEK